MPWLPTTFSFLKNLPPKIVIGAVVAALLTGNVLYIRRLQAQAETHKNNVLIAQTNLKILEENNEILEADAKLKDSLYLKYLGKAKQLEQERDIATKLIEDLNDVASKNWLNTPIPDPVLDILRKHKE